MIFTLLAIFTAALFGIVAFNVYGIVGLRANPWVDYAFWGLLAAGFGIDFIRPWIGCLLCNPAQRARYEAHATAGK